MIGRILLIVCAAAAAHADTVTIKNHSSFNGSLTMSGGVITLQAVFATGGTKMLSIQLSEVDNIGFNSTTFNPGKAPPNPTIGSSSGSRAGDVDVTVVLRAGGQRKDCKLMSIDANAVHCEGKGGDYPRKTVLRILVGAP